MKTILIVLTFFLFAGNAMSQVPMLKGKVIDKDTKEPVPFANVVWCDGKSGAVTDFDGKFVIADTRTCDTLIVSYVGYQPIRMYVEKGFAEVTIEMQSTSVTLSEYEILDYKTDALIEYSPATTTSGLFSIDGEVGSVRGSRAEGDVYYSDRSVKKASAKSESDSYMSSTPASDDMPAAAEQRAGQLTAGEVNDFTKWKLWEDIQSTDLASYNKRWRLFPENRFVVQVTNAKKLPVHDATAVLMDETGNIIWSARTDNTGKAELWAGMFENTSEKKYSINVIYNNKSYPVKKADVFQNGINFVEIPTDCSKENIVDVAFMIDATGSMGDEIAYLQAEVSDVMARVKDSLPGNTIRLAIVFYRDLGDTYVVTHKDFSNNIPEAVTYLKSNGAGGGGDYPEAVDSALSVCVNQLSWSEHAVARILFPIMDAPPHETEANINSIHRSLPRAASKGIRITPLACSGVDKSTEYLLRSLALATNGTYVFLTDHSGIGNPHIAPTTDEYKVEKLNDALVRIVVGFSTSPDCEKPLADIVQTTDTAVMNLPPVKDTIPPITDTLVQNDSLKTVNDTTAIDTTGPVLPEISWRYFPNPTDGPVTVEIINLPEATEGFLYLTDLNGKLLARYEVKESHVIQVDISMYPTGTYYLTFFYGKESKLCAPVVLLH